MFVERKGCPKSKFDKKLCARDETPKHHSDYIKKHGLKAYYELMGMPAEVIQPGIEDKSRTVNVGLVNYENKEETTNETEFNINLHWKTIIEVVVGVLSFIFITRRLIRYFKNKKAKTVEKKSIKLKEIMKEAHKPSAPAPAENPYHAPFPIAVSTIKNNSNSFPKRDMSIKVFQEPLSNQIVPIFSNNLYD